MPHAKRVKSCAKASWTARRCPASSLIAKAKTVDFEIYIVEGESAGAARNKSRSPFSSHPAQRQDLERGARGLDRMLASQEVATLISALVAASATTAGSIYRSSAITRSS